MRVGGICLWGVGLGLGQAWADTYSYEYRGLPSNSFCSYIFASLLVAIIRLQQGAPREGGEASPPNQAFVGHVAMDIIWNLIGDVERWNPNTPAPEYSRLEEPHLAINFRSIYYDDDVHTCIMMAARFVPGSPSGMMMTNWLHALCLAAPQA